MKYKKGLIILSLVVCVLFAVSSVCATDINETMVLGEESNAESDLTESVQSDADLEATDNDDISAKDSADGQMADIQSACSQGNDVVSTTRSVTGNTFADIQNVIDASSDGDIIELSGFYSGKSQIVIDKSLTINGNNAILDSKHSSGILNCKKGNIIFNNINFYNGKARDYGGAINARAMDDQGSLEINNCKFINNSARGEYGAGLGGAIYSGSDLKLTNCLFENNYADSEHFGGSAGAISGHNVVLDNCRFTQNEAHEGYYQSSHSIISAWSLNARNSKFYKNSADPIIGCDNLQLSGCTFSDNLGVCIDCRTLGTGIVKIENCVFSHNYGTVVQFSVAKLEILKTKFEKTYGCDSVIELYYNKKVTIDNCNFLNNNINSEVIDFSLLNYKNEGAVNIAVTHSKFTKNKSPNYGNNLKYTDGTLTLTGDSSCTGKIVVKVKGHTYKSKFTSGVSKIKLTGLAKGTYTAVVSYSGDSKWASFKVTIPVTLKKSTIPKKLTLKTVKVKKSAKKLILQATLKQGKTPLKGKKITFKFNGKTYKSNTNKKGVAKVTIKKKVLKKLKVGKKVVYRAIYGKLKIKKTAKVRK